MNEQQCFEQVEQQFLMPFEPQLLSGIVSAAYLLKKPPQAGVQSIIDEINARCPAIMAISSPKKEEIYLLHSPF
jgi:hypothetical protein